MKAIRVIVPIVLILCLCIGIFVILFTKSRTPSGIPVSTPDERLVYLFTQGWKGEEIAAAEITVPETTGVVYRAFAELQAAQDMPLARFAGCQAMRYTYRLMQSGLYAELLCADGMLIGAMCYDPETGEMRTIRGEPYP